MAITLKDVIPLGGGKTRYTGTFTHTAGAAPETFTLGAARVENLIVTSDDAGAKKEMVTYSQSISGSTNTVTVYKLDAVTAGRIVVDAYAGN
jgi:hypothetical protein